MEAPAPSTVRRAGPQVALRPVGALPPPERSLWRGISRACRYPSAAARGKRLPSLDGLRAISALMVWSATRERSLQVATSLAVRLRVVDVWVRWASRCFRLERISHHAPSVRASAARPGRWMSAAFLLRRALRSCRVLGSHRLIAILARMHLVLVAVELARSLSFTTNYSEPAFVGAETTRGREHRGAILPLWPALLITPARSALAAQLSGHRRHAILRILTFYVTPGMRPNITSMFLLRPMPLLIGKTGQRSARAAPHSRGWRSCAPCRRARWRLLLPLRGGVLVRPSGTSFSVTFDTPSIVLRLLGAPLGDRNLLPAYAGCSNSAPLGAPGTLSYSFILQQLWLSHDTILLRGMCRCSSAGALICAEVVTARRAADAPISSELRGVPGSSGYFSSDLIGRRLPRRSPGCLWIEQRNPDEQRERRPESRNPP